MLLHLGVHAAGRFGEQGRQVDRLRLQRHLSRGDALQVEQLVDQLEQMPAVAGDSLQEVPLLVRQRGPQLLSQQEISESDDAVERRAQLVRDIGQEQVFGFHHAVELGIQLLEPLGGLADLDGQAPGVVMRRPALAGDGEIRGRLIERGALVGPERDARDDAQHAHELGARA